MQCGAGLRGWGVNDDQLGRKRRSKGRRGAEARLWRCRSAARPTPRCWRWMLEPCRPCVASPNGDMTDEGADATAQLAASKTPYGKAPGHTPPPSCNCTFAGSSPSTRVRPPSMRCREQMRLAWRQRRPLLTRPALFLLCCALRLRVVRCANAFTAQLGPVAVVKQPPTSSAAAAASAAVLRLGAALEPAWAAAMTAHLATQGASGYAAELRRANEATDAVL